MAWVETCAGQREERALAGPLTVRIGERDASTSCVAAPQGSQPVL